MYVSHSYHTAPPKVELTIGKSPVSGALSLGKLTNRAPHTVAAISAAKKGVKFSAIGEKGIKLTGKVAHAKAGVKSLYEVFSGAVGCLMTLSWPFPKLQPINGLETPMAVIEVGTTTQTAISLIEEPKRKRLLEDKTVKIALAVLLILSVGIGLTVSHTLPLATTLVIIGMLMTAIGTMIAKQKYQLNQL